MGIMKTAIPLFIQHALHVFYSLKFIISMVDATNIPSQRILETYCRLNEYKCVIEKLEERHPVNRIILNLKEGEEMEKIDMIVYATTRDKWLSGLKTGVIEEGKENKSVCVLF